MPNPTTAPAINRARVPGSGTELTDDSLVRSSSALAFAELRISVPAAPTVRLAPSTIAPGEARINVPDSTTATLSVLSPVSTNLPEPIFVRTPTPLTLPLMVKESAGLVTSMRLSGAARSNAAEIAWLPERTLTRQSLTALLVEDSGGMGPTRQQPPIMKPPLAEVKSISSTRAEASNVTKPPPAALVKRATPSWFCGSDPELQFEAVLQNPLYRAVVPAVGGATFHVHVECPAGNLHSVAEYGYGHDHIVAGGQGGGAEAERAGRTAGLRHHPPKTGQLDLRHLLLLC